MQIGNPPGIPATAAEFSDVVAHGGGTDQGDVHLNSRLLGKAGGVDRHIVDADGVACRGEGHAVPADAQQGGEMVPGHQLPEGRILRPQTAGSQLLLVGPVQVQQGIEGAVQCLPTQKPLQHLQEECLCGTLCLGGSGTMRVGEQPG